MHLLRVLASCLLRSRSSAWETTHDVQLYVAFREKYEYGKAFVALMFACIATGSAAAGDLDQRIAALMKAAPNKNYKVMVIPSAGSFISNKIIVASLKAGTDSQSSEYIAGVLSGQNIVRLAVTSENDAVGAATLERAFSSLKAKPSVSHEITFVGEKEYEEELVAKASEAGIKLLFVPYP